MQRKKKSMPPALMLGALLAEKSDRSYVESAAAACELHGLAGELAQRAQVPGIGQHAAVPADAPAVLDVAYRYLCVMCAALSVLYLLYVYRSALQGMGDTVIPMISGIVELIMRLNVAWLLPLMLGQDGVYYAEIAAWTGATVLLAAAYYVRTVRGAV